MNLAATAVACLALGIASGAHAEGSVANAEWFACEKDKDCGRSEDICGEPKGVNLKQYKHYKRYLDDQRALVECAPPRKVFNLRELHSVCVDHQCSFNPAPNFGEQH